jgi:hypothetical protein
VKVVAGWVAAVLAVIGLAVGILAASGVGQPAHVVIRPARPMTPAPEIRWPVILIPPATFPPVSSTFETALENVVAPGSSRTVSYRVAPSESFNLWGLALHNLATGNGEIAARGPREVGGGAGERALHDGPPEDADCLPRR